MVPTMRMFAMVTLLSQCAAEENIKADKKDFVVTKVGEYCPKGTDITNQAVCESAAGALRKDFVHTKKPEGHQLCSLQGVVHFNTASVADSSAKPDKQTASVCVAKPVSSKAEAAKAAEDKKAAEKKAEEKKAADEKAAKAAAEKKAAEKKAEEKKAADAKAAKAKKEAKIAAEIKAAKAAEDKQAAEKKAREKKIADAKAAKDKREAEKKAEEKKAAEAKAAKAAADKKEAEKKAAGKKELTPKELAAKRAAYEEKMTDEAEKQAKEKKAADAKAANAKKEADKKAQGKKAAEAKAAKANVLTGDMTLKVIDQAQFVSGKGVKSALKAALANLLGVTAGQVEIVSMAAAARRLAASKQAGAVSVKYTVTDPSLKVTPAMVSGIAANLPAAVNNQLNSKSLPGSLFVSSAVVPAPTVSESATKPAPVAPVATAAPAVPAGVVQTNLAAPVAAGATVIEVGSVAGFTVGSRIMIGDEYNVIKGFSSIILQNPLAKNHPKGTVVKPFVEPNPCAPQTVTTTPPAPVVSDPCATVAKKYIPDEGVKKAVPAVSASGMLWVAVPALVGLAVLVRTVFHRRQSQTRTFQAADDYDTLPLTQGVQAALE